MDPGRWGILLVLCNIRDLKFDETDFNVDLSLDSESVGLIQVVKLFCVFSNLWVVDREDLHKEVSWVGKPRDLELESSEVLHGVASISLENDESIAHEDKSVEVEECIG